MSRRFAIALLCAVLLASCGGGESGTPQSFGLPANAMVLRIAETDDIPTLDPAAGYDTVSWTMEQALFDMLLRYGDDNINLENDLATSWSASPDARTFTFHIRRDARFSTGRTVTSDDFRYGIERVIDPATHSRGMEYYLGIAGANEFQAHRAAHVSGIETPDEWTIVFHLAAADPIFPHKLAMPFASAIPREVAEKWGEDFSRHPVGSGAFMLKEWRSGQRLILVRNP
ncbi:MAG TPA: ABC transporter substrate-binding protein, partial [Candidatus Binataceae bacterium]|nr:ABC transporter substrate-binding protein [Candidatus Binataceae bacterium]